MDDIDIMPNDSLSQFSAMASDQEIDESTGLMPKRNALLLVDSEPNAKISLIVVTTPSLLFIRTRRHSHGGNGMNPTIVISL